MKTPENYAWSTATVRNMNPQSKTVLERHTNSLIFGGNSRYYGKLRKRMRDPNPPCAPRLERAMIPFVHKKALLALSVLLYGGFVDGGER